mmetsp:Transcript_29114/g.85358  ORF Transcript_29114/g.85358 Transcript_29114/m.85358 type:complete len:452 (+) Transcript_29114:38-1393(+)
MFLTRRPTAEVVAPPAGEPMENAGRVRVGISFELVLLSISDAEETFKVELDIKYTWQARGFYESYVRGGRPRKDSREFEALVEDCWDPHVRISNVDGTEELVSNKTICVDIDTGRMHRYTKYRVALAEGLELERFPFDRQCLGIHLHTFRDTSEVIFGPYDGRPSLVTSRANRWKLYNNYDPLMLIPDPASLGLIATSGRSYHRAFIVLEVERDYHWYLVHFFLPHAIILVMNANVVVIDRNFVADRCAVTLTMLLTAVAFQFLLVSEVPKKRYLTILDRVIAMGLTLQLITCAMVFLHADNPSLPERSFNPFYEVSDETVGQIEILYMWVIILPWLLFNLGVSMLAMTGKFHKSFGSMMKQTEQDWIAKVLGGKMAGDKVTGSYTLWRVGTKRGLETVTLVDGERVSAPEEGNTVFNRAGEGGCFRPASQEINRSPSLHSSHKDKTMGAP